VYVRTPSGLDFEGTVSPEGDVVFTGVPADSQLAEDAEPNTLLAD